MSNFHKPKMYRSASGCCICRAKSSSSRFTDSKKYEEDFVSCFKLSEVRSGEICNACVLLVKRWKKLPIGSQRNWNHVVDARAGHGSRPLSKINKKKNKAKEEKALLEREHEHNRNEELETEKKKIIFIPELKHTNPRTRELSPSGFSDDVQLECLSSESGSFHSSREASPIPSPEHTVICNEEPVVSLNRQNIIVSGNSRRRRLRGTHPKKFCSSVTNHQFLDLNFWKREKTCCGIIFKGPFGELLLDRRYLNPCFCRSSSNSTTTSPEFETIPTGERLDCFAIDSGYEDSSSNLTVDTFHVLTNVSTTLAETKISGECKGDGFNENYARHTQNGNVD